VLSKLAGRLLVSIDAQGPVMYAELLESYGDERTCRVSSCLRQLQHNGLVTYSRGKYTTTALGQEELNKREEQ